MNEQQRKKIIAREILIFFSALVLLSIVGLFLVIQNYYYQNQLANYQKEIAVIDRSIDSLSADGIKKLYNTLEPKFIVNYKVLGNEYYISKKEENSFLIRFPIAQLQPIDPSGYISVNTHDSTQIGNHGIAFYYVDFNQFKTLIKNAAYRDKLYLVLSSNYPFQSKQSFNAGIETALYLVPRIEQRKQSFINKKADTEKLLQAANANILAKHELFYLLALTAALFGIVLYPIRVCVLLLQWSIKNIK